MEKIIKELESLKLSNTEFRAGSYNEGINAALYLIKSSLPKPVEVPGFVASWYEENKDYPLSSKFMKAQHAESEKIQNWYNNCKGRHANKRANAQEIIAKMDLYGYTVVKEPTTHKLKIQPEYYDALLLGIKTFEIRKNDRDFKVGDILKLSEFKDGVYTGGSYMAKIIYITDYAQQEGYVVLGIEPVEGMRNEQRNY